MRRHRVRAFGCVAGNLERCEHKERFAVGLVPVRSASWVLRKVDEFVQLTARVKRIATERLDALGERVASVYLVILTQSLPHALEIVDALRVIASGDLRIRRCRRHRRRRRDVAGAGAVFVIVRLVRRATAIHRYFARAVERLVHASVRVLLEDFGVPVGQVLRVDDIAVERRLIHPEHAAHALPVRARLN